MCVVGNSQKPMYESRLEQSPSLSTGRYDPRSHLPPAQPLASFRQSCHGGVVLVPIPLAETNSYL